MQLKAIIRNKSKEANVSAQLVLQNFMLERLLERISVSEYRNHLILKGGFLIAAMVGLDTRATMDMDVTLKGMPISSEQVSLMFNEICKIDVDDPFQFTFNSVSEIREGDTYNGYRVSLNGNYPPMAVPLKIDITTGDKITPGEIDFSYKLMFEDRILNVLSYNLETVLAEKVETIISRGDQNTRPRDFYDVYILFKLKRNQIDNEVLKQALNETMNKRNTIDLILRYEEIIEIIRGSEVMAEYWEKYQRDFDFAAEITFDEAVEAVSKILHSIND